LGRSVVGFGVGTVGEVEGDGVGVTVCTDGPALVSPARPVDGRWYAMTRTMAANTAARITIGRISVRAERR
jgi:hypothetical protein